MDPLRAQQLAAELEVEMMADMYNRQKTATARASMDALLESLLQHTPWCTRSAWSVTTVSFGHSDQLYPIIAGHRMTGACHKKCVPPHYKEPELSKGESVCLDRCVSKYLDIHERMGKKLTELSMQDEELMKKMQQGMGPGQ